MSVSEYCNREVIIARASESIHEAVRLMRSEHVGDLVIVREEQGENIPEGILTDRDIVIELVAKEVPLDTVSIGDVMSTDIITIDEGKDLLEATELMSDHGIRRLPVVNGRGGLVGLLTVDDILELVSEQLYDLVSLVGRQREREKKLRSRA